MTLRQYAELAEGDTWGAVNTLHQRHVAVVVFSGESGVAELGNNGGLGGHSTSRILPIGGVATSEESGLVVEAEVERHAVPRPRVDGEAPAGPS